MRTIIVGGGLAGLTLASALEKAGIDYVLLEARSQLDPQVGASIGLNAGALRILDQVGAAQDIIKHTAPVKVSKVHRQDGKLIMPPSFAFQIFKARFGYGVSFLDRQLVLRALANSVTDRSRLLLDKIVVNVTHTDIGVDVECSDGSSYHGDIVVGCDGVNSKSAIRNEMNRLASEVDPEIFPPSEKTRMKAEYICLFGISNPVVGLNEGDVDTTIDKGRSMLVITGKDGRVFWFYNEKLDRVYHFNAENFPKYSKADAEKLALKNAWRCCNETVTLGDLWKNRLTYTLVPLEEALFDKWSWGRIATVGDNAHKMTPNHGQAGNNAVESAAALANQLKKLHDSGVTTPESIRLAFQKWQEKRQIRINATVKEAAAICRMQALDSRAAYFLMAYVLPNANELLLKMVTNTLIGSEILEYLPVPDQSFDGSCPFNPHQGTGKHESLLRRTIVAAPLLVFAYWTATSTSVGSLEDAMTKTLLWTQMIQHPVQWLGTFRFIVDAALVYSLWLLESNRRANLMTFARFPLLFCILGHSFGIGPGVVAPVYYAVHYIFSGVENFAAADTRLTNLAYTRTVLPVVLLCFAAPLLLALSGQSISVGNRWWSWSSWLLPPLMISIAQRILVKSGMSKNTMHEDAMTNQKRDLPHIRLCVYVLSAISAAAWVYTTLHALLMHTSASALSPGTPSGLVGLHRHAVILSSHLWIGLLIFDLKKAGMVEQGWAKMFGAGLVLDLLGGPAVSVSLGWLWREGMLASRKERHAITRDKYAGKSIVDLEMERSSLAGTGAN